MIYELVDDFLTPWEIDSLLDKAIVLCPAMKRSNAPQLYPVNICRLFPNCSEDFARFGAMLLNELVKEI